MGHVVTPSYRSGFYSPRRGGVTKYPSLWRGCIGAWCPSLGATGGRLFDQSLYQNHGTLTSMDAATDWVPSAGKMVLDFVTDDYVNVPMSDALLLGPVTLCAWVLIRGASLNAFMSKHTGGGGTNNPFDFRTGTAANNLTIVRANASSYVSYSGPSLASNTWIHVGVMFNGAASNVPVFWVNGKSTAGTVDAGSLSGPVTGSNTDMRLGRRADGSVQLDGLADDYRMYNRMLSSQEMNLLASRRGVAYELATSRRNYYVAAPAGSRKNNMAMGCGF
jgi:hypothetical protein